MLGRSIGEAQYSKASLPVAVYQHLANILSPVAKN